MEAGREPLLNTSNSSPAPERSTFFPPSIVRRQFSSLRVGVLVPLEQWWAVSRSAEFLTSPAHRKTPLVLAVLMFAVFLLDLSNHKSWQSCFKSDLPCLLLSIICVFLPRDAIIWHHARCAVVCVWIVSRKSEFHSHVNLPILWLIACAFLSLFVVHSMVVGSWNFLFGLLIIHSYGRDWAMIVVFVGTLLSAMGVLTDMRDICIYLQVKQATKALSMNFVHDFGCCTVDAGTSEIIHVSPNLKEMFNGANLLGRKFVNLVHPLEKFLQLLRGCTDKSEPILVTVALPKSLKTFDCKIIPYLKLDNKLSMCVSVVGEGQHQRTTMQPGRDGNWTGTWSNGNWCPSSSAHEASATQNSPCGNWSSVWSSSSARAASMTQNTAQAANGEFQPPFFSLSASSHAAPAVYRDEIRSGGTWSSVWSESSSRTAPFPGPFTISTTRAFNTRILRDLRRMFASSRTSQVEQPRQYVLQTGRDEIWNGVWSETGSSPASSVSVSSSLIAQSTIRSVASVAMSRSSRRSVGNEREHGPVGKRLLNFLQFSRRVPMGAWVAERFLAERIPGANEKVQEFVGGPNVTSASPSTAGSPAAAEGRYVLQSQAVFANAGGIVDWIYTVEYEVSTPRSSSARDTESQYNGSVRALDWNIPRTPSPIRSNENASDTGSLL